MHDPIGENDVSHGNSPASLKPISHYRRQTTVDENRTIRTKSYPIGPSTFRSLLMYKLRMITIHTTYRLFASTCCGVVFAIVLQYSWNQICIQALRLFVYKEYLLCAVYILCVCLSGCERVFFFRLSFPRFFVVAVIVGWPLVGEMELTSAVDSFTRY